MNPENQNESRPVTPNTIPVTPSQTSIHEERALGPAIGVVIIIFVLVLGGLYFWGQRMNNQRILKEQMQAESMIPAQNTETTDPELQQIKQQSTSDSLDAIDADLKATNTTNIGTEVDSMNSAISE